MNISSKIKLNPLKSVLCTFYSGNQSSGLILKKQ